jgi:Holliday junction DNA helicase RuvA
MIESLRGELLLKAPDHAVVECHGVGYLVYISATTWEKLPPKGECRLAVHYAVSVDVRSGQSEHRLYGFVDTGERELFRRLIDVQGVSSTLGLAIMGSGSADDLRAAIASGDVGVFKAVKGIGPKLAQRIVTELHGRLGAGTQPSPHAPAVAGNSLEAEALSALVSLGLDRSKAERGLRSILQERKTDRPSLEELIKLVLKHS